MVFASEKKKGRNLLLSKADEIQGIRIRLEFVYRKPTRDAGWIFVTR